MAVMEKGLVAMIMVAVVGGVGVGWIFRKDLPPQIPLWYSRPWGEEQLAPKWALMVPAALAVGIGLLGIASGRVIKDRVLVTLVGGGCLIAQVILVLGMWRIIWLVV